MSTSPIGSAARARRTPALAIMAVVIFSHAASAAVLVPTNLDVAGLRKKMFGEGLLEHVANSYATNANNPLRSGEEFTGWIDVRHPALGGAANSMLGYDRYERQLDQATTILRDYNNLLPLSANVVRDLDHANTAYARQAGVSVIERSNTTYTSPAMGQPGAFDFPLSHGLGAAQNGLPMEEQAIMQQNTAAQINVYYARSLQSNANGETYHPSFTGGGNNEGVFMADAAGRQTLTHEIAHYITDSDAIHMPDGGDPAHSSDPRNVVGSRSWRPGMAQDTWAAGAPPWNIPNTDAVAGPSVSTADGTAGGAPKVGGVVQFKRSQVFTTGKGLFGDTDVNPYLTQANNANAGNQVDWNFVVDDWITEDLGGGADVHPGGRESLYFTAGNPTVDPDPVATADNGGKKKDDLGLFSNPAAWTGTFNYADVFSLGTRYGDYDVDANDGDLSARAASLDYDVRFVLPNDTIVPGVPIAVFVDGWSSSASADNWLARWMSPSPAKGVLVTAHRYMDLVTNEFIGNTQIDAVIVANRLVPEPATAALALFALLLAGWHHRARQGANKSRQIS